MDRDTLLYAAAFYALLILGSFFLRSNTGGRRAVIFTELVMIAAVILSKLHGFPKIVASLNKSMDPYVELAQEYGGLILAGLVLAATVFRNPPAENDEDQPAPSASRYRPERCASRTLAISPVHSSPNKVGFAQSSQVVQSPKGPIASPSEASCTKKCATKSCDTDHSPLLSTVSSKRHQESRVGHDAAGSAAKDVNVLPCSPVSLPSLPAAIRFTRAPSDDTGSTSRDPSLPPSATSMQLDERQLELPAIHSSIKDEMFPRSPTCVAQALGKLSKKTGNKSQRSANKENRPVITPSKLKGSPLTVRSVNVQSTGPSSKALETPTTKKLKTYSILDDPARLWESVHSPATRVQTASVSKFSGLSPKAIASVRRQLSASIHAPKAQLQKENRSPQTGKVSLERQLFASVNASVPQRPQPQKEKFSKIPSFISSRRSLAASIHAPASQTKMNSTPPKNASLKPHVECQLSSPLLDTSDVFLDSGTPAQTNCLHTTILLTPSSSGQNVPQLSPSPVFLAQTHFSPFLHALGNSTPPGKNVEQRCPQAIYPFTFTSPVKVKVSPYGPVSPPSRPSCLSPQRVARPSPRRSPRKTKYVPPFRRRAEGSTVPEKTAVNGGELAVRYARAPPNDLETMIQTGFKRKRAGVV